MLLLIQQAMFSNGIHAIVSLFVVLLSIVFVWMLLQEVKWEKLLRHPKSVKSRMLQVVIAVVIGYLFASFILDYWGFSTSLQTLLVEVGEKPHIIG